MICDCQRCSNGLKALGLKRPATFDEITTAYRDLAKVWHPDRFENDPRLRKKAEEEFKSVQSAYTDLKDHRGKASTERVGSSDMAVREEKTARQVPLAFDLSQSDASRIFRSVIDGRHFRLPSDFQFPKLLSIAQDAHVKNIEDIRLIVGDWVFTSVCLIIRGFFSNKEVPYTALPNWEFSLRAGPDFATDRFLERLTNQESQILFLDGDLRSGGWDHISIGNLPDSLMVKFHQAIGMLQKEVLPGA